MNPFKPKKDEPPRILYATLSIAEGPFENNNNENSNKQRMCRFSFRVIDSADIFPHSDIDLIQEGTIHYNRNVGHLHFRLAVCSRSIPEYIYTGVLQTGAVKNDLPRGVEFTEGNRWSRTVGLDMPTVCEGITRMFLGHPKLHRFLFGAEQKG